MNLTDAYEAYCLDEAVAVFGASLAGELEAVEGKTSGEIQGKRDQLLRRYLTVGEEEPSTKGLFKDPVSLFEKQPSS